MDTAERRSAASARWHQAARCRSPYAPSVEVFFPRPLSAVTDRVRALACCACCPVRDECLEATLEIEERDRRHPYGIFGGLDADARKRILRTRRGEHPEPALASAHRKLRLVDA